MKRLLIPSTLILAIFTIFTAFTGEPTYDLKLNLTKGLTYHLMMDGVQATTQTNGTRSDTMRQTTTQFSDWMITGIDPENNINGKHTYKRIQCSMKHPKMGNFVYDTDKPDSETIKRNQTVAQFSAMKGLSYLVTISPKGEVKKISDLEQLATKLKERLGQRARGNPFLDQFSELALKETIEQFIKVYPEKPVQIGESWTVVLTQTAVAPMILENTYTLKSVTAGKATISCNSNILPVSLPVEAGPMTREMEIRGTQTGTIILDLKTGLIQSSVLTQNVNTKMTVTGRDVKQPIIINGNSDNTFTFKMSL